MDQQKIETSMNLERFYKFAEVFVPWYEDLAKIDKSPHMVVHINMLRELLCNQFNKEANMLTVPFIEWIERPLCELGIQLLYDRGNSSRTGRIALTRSRYLNECGKIEHYLITSYDKNKEQGK